MWKRNVWKKYIYIYFRWIFGALKSVVLFYCNENLYERIFVVNLNEMWPDLDHQWCVHIFFFGIQNVNQFKFQIVKFMAFKWFLFLVHRFYIENEWWIPCIIIIMTFVVIIESNVLHQLYCLGDHYSCRPKALLTQWLKRVNTTYAFFFKYTNGNSTQTNHELQSNFIKYEYEYEIYKSMTVFFLFHRKVGQKSH